METLADPTASPKFSSKNGVTFNPPDQNTWLGYLFLLASTGLYGLEEYFDISREDDNFGIFFIHYFLALAFVAVLLLKGAYGIRRSWKKESLHETIILLNLFLVSAYALNRELPVFDESVPWLCVYLIITSGGLLSYRYFNILPRFVNYIQQIVLGSSIILYLYMAIYVANFYMLGTVGILLIGIGMHIFVPLLLLVAAVRLLILTDGNKRFALARVLLGATTTIVFAVGFIIEWNARVRAIDRLANQSVIYADTELPVWVKIAETIKRDWITERILKSRLVYSVSNKHFQWDLFPNSDWSEKKRHDPLVFLASERSNSSLSRDDRINILKAITDNRHRAQERLWSGDNLSTAYIVTDIDLYPDLRIAYSEHYLNIRNNIVNDNRWWGNSQEAIYTFQLPEGSVVTSLSLWVNGVEEKAILTSKQKATEAYTTIVGHERRDPSVVHWQEGNTISVRVFPCTPEEERKFKIGITSPLPVVGNKVIYKNITFDGPNASAATQTSRLRIIGNSGHIDVPGSFERNPADVYMREGNYDPDLIIAMDATPLRVNQFSFDGFSYSLVESSPVFTDVVFSNIYLDINESWTSDEIESFYSLATKYRLYAYVGNQFLRITADNWAAVTGTLRQANFSIFPFHHIDDTDKSVVVTKGSDLSPHLRDFRTSAFANGMGEYFASGRKVYVFNLDGGTPTYIRSLKELRAFHFAQGNTATFLDLLSNNKCPLVIESAEQVALGDSHMTIERNAAMNESLKNSAPDHLARLFAYNNIMRQIGVGFFSDDFVNEALVDEAATAYVVSPVSSLIVLETKEDYDRFGIKDKENSLHNATRDSAGAVPEPHEWALIILFIGFVVFHVLGHSTLIPRFHR